MLSAGKDITHRLGDPLHRGSCCCPLVVLPCHPIPTAFLQPDSGFADTAYACPATREGSAPPPGRAGWQNSVSQGQKGVWNQGKGEGGVWVPSWEIWSYGRCILQGSLLLWEETCSLCSDPSA